MGSVEDMGEVQSELGKVGASNNFTYIAKQ